MMKKTMGQTVRFFLVLLVVALLALVMGRIMDLSPIRLSTASCQKQEEHFEVAADARNKSAQGVSATLRFTVLHRIRHGRGSSTWEPVAHHDVDVSLSAGETRKITARIPNSEFVMIPRPRAAVVAQVEVQEIRE